MTAAADAASAVAPSSTDTGDPADAKIVDDIMAKLHVIEEQTRIHSCAISALRFVL